MKIVCTKCEVELRPEKNGVYCVETFDGGKPYKVWHADLKRCPGCGFEVVTGFGSKPIKEHFEEGFEDWFHELKWPKEGNGVRLYYDYEN